MTYHSNLGLVTPTERGAPGIPSPLLPGPGSPMSTPTPGGLPPGRPLSTTPTGDPTAAPVRNEISSIAVRTSPSTVVTPTAPGQYVARAMNEAARTVGDRGMAAKLNGMALGVARFRDQSQIDEALKVIETPALVAILNAARRLSMNDSTPPLRSPGPTASRGGVVSTTTVVDGARAVLRQIVAAARAITRDRIRATGIRSAADVQLFTSKLSDTIVTAGVAAGSTDRAKWASAAARTVANMRALLNYYGNRSGGLKPQIEHIAALAAQVQTEQRPSAPRPAVFSLPSTTPKPMPVEPPRHAESKPASVPSIYDSMPATKPPEPYKPEGSIVPLEPPPAMNPATDEPLDWSSVPGIDSSTPGVDTMAPPNVTTPGEQVIPVPLIDPNQNVKRIFGVPWYYVAGGAAAVVVIGGVVMMRRRSPTPNRRRRSRR